MKQKLIISGEPHVPQMNTDAGTQYTHWKWVDDPEIFIPIAQHGSLCTQIFLETRGIDWKAV